MAHWTCLALLFGISGLSISWIAAGKSNHITPLDGEEEADLGALLPRLTSILPYIYAKVLSLNIGEAGEAQVWQLADEYGIFTTEDFSDVNNFTGPSEKCVECRALVGILQTAAENGDYYELEEAVLDLCYDIVNDSDDLGIPEFICPGIIENYVSHALLVLNGTDRDQIDICVMWNECIYTDFDPPLSEDTLVCQPPDIPPTVKRPPKNHKRPRDLENAIKVVHMTDIHVDLEYDIGFAGYWGDYLCNQPIPITDVMLQFVASLNPAYVMYTGDSPPHTVWLDTYESQIESGSRLAQSFGQALPNSSIYYALGNHDIHPTNLYFFNRTDVQQGNIDLASIWGPLGGFGPEQIETFHNAAYYTILLQPGLRLLTYNSNYGWLENFYSIFQDQPSDYLEMKLFMESTLEAARQNGEKVIVLNHHISGQSAGHNEYSCFVTDIHARYGDVIILNLSGHKHGDLYRLVRDISTGVTRGVQISSPAGGSRTDRNPSLRVFYVDPVTFDVLDADTFRVNMSLLAGDPDGSIMPQVEFGYRFTEEYGMADLSTEAFEDFVFRLEADDALFQKYLYNEATGNPARVDDCDAECKVEEICQMKNTAYPGYLICTGEI